ncbi:TMV resistance protein N-like [Vigna radiata var. radiata]|uniref:TMV resistance protein N-like n=1 Tax=Vigna radiata var. radiata TaxID=3916 RepID=A0A1S3VB87_VIGRR|nr:TMV resistance protein N-like [Vigna radiata var. radiata]
MEFASSSSSSSSSFLKSEPHFLYDVFISFGEEEIGRKFVSHLHSALLQAQVKTFIDVENLSKEMKLEEHMRAIERTKITIIIFSKRYTESACCLLELEKVIECHQSFGQIVLPVFYEIEAFDVRHHKNDFGKAMEETAHKSYSGELVEHALSRWSRALFTAAGIIGWDVTDFWHDAQLVKKIVGRVQTLLDYKDLFITQYPVALLESRVEDVIKYIENQPSKVCIIGIWGMRGSGKKTIAKAIYNRIYREFIGKSFIENITEFGVPDNKSYVGLQRHLHFDVLKSWFDVDSIGIGRTMIEKELSQKKLLIVLDDVNDFVQFEIVCGNCEWLGQGSVIVITTRDVHVLNGIKVNYVYKMDGMNENDSLELLSWHAFGEGKPRKDLDDLARNIAAYCRGLPLALELLGSFLYDKTMNERESVWSKLNRTPMYDIESILEICFELEAMEKDIFLEVCRFYIGKERGYVTDILNALGLHANIGITVLIERGLIKVDSDNKLEMDPLLQHIGKEISRERSSRGIGSIMDSE